MTPLKYVTGIFLLTQAGWMIDFTKPYGIVYLPSIYTTLILSANIWFMLAIAYWIIGLAISGMIYLIPFPVSEAVNWWFFNTSPHYGVIWNDLFYLNVLFFFIILIKRMHKTYIFPYDR